MTLLTSEASHAPAYPLRITSHHNITRNDDLTLGACVLAPTKACHQSPIRARRRSTLKRASLLRMSPPSSASTVENHRQANWHNKMPINFYLYLPHITFGAGAYSSALRTQLVSTKHGVQTLGLGNNLITPRSWYGAKKHPSSISQQHVAIKFQQHSGRALQHTYQQTLIRSLRPTRTSPQRERRFTFTFLLLDLSSVYSWMISLLFSKAAKKLSASFESLPFLVIIFPKTAFFSQSSLFGNTRLMED